MSKQTERKYDKRGVPIYPGDLLRSDHFAERLSGGRIKKHFVFHVVTVAPDGLYLVTPAAWLETRKAPKPGTSRTGECHLWILDTETLCRVVQGDGPGDTLDFDDRPKRNRATAADTEGRQP